MRDGMHLVVHPVYTERRPCTFDDVIHVGLDARSLEEWWWRCNTGEVADRVALARAIARQLGPRHCLELCWVHERRHMEPAMRTKFGLHPTQRGARLLDDVMRVLGREYPEETCAVFEELNDTWLGERPEERWFDLGGDIARITAAFARAGGRTPGNIAALLAGLHMSPPRPRIAAMAAASVLGSVPAELHASIWDAIKGSYSVSFAEFMEEWRELMEWTPARFLDRLACGHRADAAVRSRIPSRSRRCSRIA
jgi:hypothetical protein